MIHSFAVLLFYFTVLEDTLSSIYLDFPLSSFIKNNNNNDNKNPIKNQTNRSRSTMDVYWVCKHMYTHQDKKMDEIQKYWILSKNISSLRITNYSSGYLLITLWTTITSWVVDCSSNRNIFMKNSFSFSLKSKPL